MNYFYFNECIGSGYSIQALCSSFEKTIAHFCEIKSDDRCVLVFEKEPDHIILSDHSLLDICKESRNKDFKKIVYSHLKNNPLADFIPSHNEIDEESILRSQYSFESQDALNLAIAYYCDWIAFSLPLSSTLRQDKLKLTSTTSETLYMFNFHGDNINATEEAIRETIFKRAKGVEKMKAIAKNVSLTPEFLKEFKESPSTYQELIVSRFEYAKQQGIILSKPKTNNSTVVDTIPKRKYVEELRIVNPIDIRVYFHQVDQDTIVVASMNTKNRYHRGNQNADIEHAEQLIKEHLGIKET